MSVELSEIEAIAKTVAKATVAETFRVLGVDIENPFEVQKDFAHLRTWRKYVEAGRLRAITALIFTLVTGALGAVWFAITHGFK